MCCVENLGARWIVAFNPDTDVLLPRNRVPLLFLDQPSVIKTEFYR